MTEVTKRVLETGLKVEMSDHLGYDKHAREGRNGGLVHPLTLEPTAVFVLESEV